MGSPSLYRVVHISGRLTVPNALLKSIRSMCASGVALFMRASILRIASVVDNFSL